MIGNSIELQMDHSVHDAVIDGDSTSRLLWVSVRNSVCRSVISSVNLSVYLALSHSVSNSVTSTIFKDEWC